MSTPHEKALEEARRALFSWRGVSRSPGEIEFVIAAYNKSIAEQGWRPDWREVMKGCGGSDLDSNDLLPATRETLWLASCALERSQAEDAYHNYGAALAELRAVLTAAPSPDVTP